MAQSDLTIHVHTLDGKIVTLGADQAAGVWPENFNGQSDRWGPSAASFELRRDTAMPWPDLAGGSRVDVEVAGTRVWSGRIKEIPTRDGDQPMISVQCEGPQYHLDDDGYERAYVIERLDRWRDQRSFLTADLTTFVAGWQIQTDGAIVITWPDSAGAAPNALEGGVTLDLGEASTAKRIVVTFEKTNDGNGWLRLRGTDTEKADSSGEIADWALSGSGATTQAYTFVAARRFLHLSYYRNNSFDFATDLALRITAVRVFADTAYEAGGVSTLTAPTIVKDALERATVRLSSDESQIDTTSPTFAIPEFALDGPKTAREAIDAADAYEDRLKQVDVDWRLVYKPRPTAPEVEIGDWPGSEFTDASANSIAAIRNRVLVTGTDAAGSPLTVSRRAVQASGARLEQTTDPAPVNPSFDTDTTGWTAGAGTTITRETLYHDTAPASGKWAGVETGETLIADFSGTFKKGHTYRITIRGSMADPSLAHYIRSLELGLLETDQATRKLTTLTRDQFIGRADLDEWVTQTIEWMPRHNRTGVQLRITAGPVTGGPGTWYFDEIKAEIDVSTLPSRQGYTQWERLPVRSALTTAVGERIGDLYLAAHRTTPFKGDGTIQAGGARRILGGAEIHPAELLLHSGRRVRHANRIDPDTGGHGRDGTIAAVSYQWPANVAQVTFDDERHRIEALLERLAVVIGS